MGTLEDTGTLRGSYNIPDDGVHRRHWDSVAEFIEGYQKLKPKNCRDEDAEYFDQKRKGNSWSFGQCKGFTTPIGLAAALSEGRAIPAISESARRIAENAAVEMQGRAELLGLGRKRKSTWEDDEGDWDAERVRRGDELCRRDRRILSGTRPTISIGVNLGLSCGNDESSFSALAGNVAAAALVAESLGLSTKIVAIIALQGDNYSGQGCCYSWTIKDQSEYVDVDRVCSVGAPGFFRHFVFGLLATCPSFGGSKGLCRVNREQVKQIAGVDYLMGQSWTNDNQERLFDGIAGAIAERMDGAGNLI